MAEPKFYFGTTRFKIQGVNFSVLLNDLSLSGIKVNKVERPEVTQLVFVCPTRDRKKVIAILKQRCYNVLEQQNSHSFNFFRSVITRFGILIGIGVGVLLNVFASFFIWNVMLYGQEDYSEQIFSVLVQNGMGAGSWKFGIKPEDAEQVIYDSIPEISLVDISFRGCSLIVNYTIRTQEDNDQTVSKNILAKADGVVSSILVTSGTAMVKVGDFVRKGQLLIAGYQTVNDSQVDCNAKGQVYAYSWISATVEFPLEKIEWVRTGNYVENVSVSLFGSVLYSKTQENVFAKSESEQTTEYMFRSGAIPLTVTRTFYYELEARTVSQSFEDNYTKTQAQARLLAWEQIEGDEDILDEKTEVNFVSNIWFVTHYIKIKEKIS